MSTNCLPALKKSFSLPIVGVIDAGCQAALQASKTKRIGVIGTRATVNSHAYERRIRELCPEAKTWGVECPLFVPLIENGFAPDDPITEMTVERYLSAFQGTGVDTVIMGCTHYPFLTGTLEKTMPGVFINVGKAISFGLRQDFDLPESGAPNHGVLLRQRRGHRLLGYRPPVSGRRVSRQRAEGEHRSILTRIPSLPAAYSGAKVRERGSA